MLTQREGTPRGKRRFRSTWRLTADFPGHNTREIYKADLSRSCVTRRDDLRRQVIEYASKPANV